MKNQTKNAIKWIDKLSTTRMKQGRLRLGGSKIGYCCLGVGCKVLGIEYRPEGVHSEKLKSEVGLRCLRGGGLRYDGELSDLVALNDSRQLSFRKISTVIKNNLHELFIPEVAKELSQHYAQ